MVLLFSRYSMNKIPYISQNTETKTLPADVCVFGRFGRLSPAAIQPADCLFYSGVKWCIYFMHCHIFTQKLFCCIETVANNALNHWRVVVFDWLWANPAPSLNTALSLTNVLAKWWIHCLLISSTLLLFHAIINLWSAKMSLWNILVFSRTTAKFGRPECSASFVCMTISIPPLNCCFWQSRVWITLINPFALLEQYFFPSESNALLTHEIQIFPLIWKSATVSKVGDRSRGWSEGSLFNSYYTEV